MAFMSNDVKCAVGSKSGGLSCALRSVNKSTHFVHSFQFDLGHTDETLTIVIHSFTMSQKIPGSPVVEECKEFDSASWTDDDEATATTVEFQRLPSRGFRGALIRYYWVCSPSSMQIR